MRREFAALPLLLLSACSDLEFRQARRLEDKREFDRAAASFERALEGSPGGPRETEMLVRLGRIYAEEFGRCERALPLRSRRARVLLRRGEPGNGLVAGPPGPDVLPGLFPAPGRRPLGWVDSQSGGPT